MLLADLATTSSALATTRSRLAKRALLVDLLRRTPPEDVGIVSRYLGGQLRQRRTDCRGRQRRQRAPAQPGPPLPQLTPEVPRDDPDVLGRCPAQQVDQEGPLGQPGPRRGEGGRRRRQVDQQHPCILPPGTDIPRAGSYEPIPPSTYSQRPSSRTKRLVSWSRPRRPSSSR